MVPNSITIRTESMHSTAREHLAACSSSKAESSCAELEKEPRLVSLFNIKSVPDTNQLLSILTYIYFAQSSSSFETQTRLIPFLTSPTLGLFFLSKIIVL